MKTPADYVRIIHCLNTNIKDDLKIIEEIQNDAWNSALDAVLKMDCDTMEDETGRVYIPVDEIYELKK